MDYLLSYLFGFIAHIVGAFGTTSRIIRLSVIVGLNPKLW